MIIDIVFETVGPILGRIFGYIFLHLLLNTVFYITGFVILTLVTFGKYPKRFKSISDAALDSREGWVIFAGGIFWFIVLLLLFAK